MLTLGNYRAEANHCARTVIQTLTKRGLFAVLEFYLTERNGLVWLAVILDLSRLQGRLEGFVSAETLHHLSTVLQGKKVFLSNSTGLRYMILLTPVPRLPDSVPYPDLIDLNAIPLGVGLSGPILLPGMRNMLICGEPGSGKSNLLEGILIAALRSGMLLYLVDPDGITFNPDVLNALAAQPVAQSAQEFRVLLEKLAVELLRRQSLYHSVAVDGQPPANLEAYNRVASQPLPPILLLVDEANSYFDDKDILEKLTDLARRGRKWGLAVVLAGHNWRAKDVPRALSAMFPVRISFRVADDTSGVVVLGSRRWGKEAQHLRQPGRGILLLDGQYRIFQAYYLQPEQARASLQQPVDIDPLDPIEKTLVSYALQHLEGRFIVNRLAQSLAGQGITHHQVQKVAEQFERRGWLTKPGHATDARRITPELALLAGFSRTGVQAVQERTGSLQPVQETVQAL